MIKSLTAIGVSALLLLGLGLFEWFYVHDQFASFGEEVLSLYDKAENETANVEDARAVFASWEERKSKLHVWIPHNDIARIDDYLAESVQLIEEREYALALARLEIVLHLSTSVPSTYEPGIENIF